VTFVATDKFGENAFYRLEISTDLHFCFQSLKCDILPRKLLNCGNSTPLTFLFPKCPRHKFYFFKKKNPKKKKPKKKMLGWPNHPLGGGRPPRLA
jgi:hypothetical protein